MKPTVEVDGQRSIVVWTFLQAFPVEADPPGEDPGNQVLPVHITAEHINHFQEHNPCFRKLIRPWEHLPVGKTVPGRLEALDILHPHRLDAPGVIDQDFPVNAEFLIKPLFIQDGSLRHFPHIRTEKDILKLVNTIIANTKGDGEKSSEDFWVKAERLLYCALIGFIYYEAPEEEQNFSTLLEFLNASEAREDDEEFQNAVDLMFEDLEAEDPEHFVVRQYKKYKLAAGAIS